MKNVLLGMSSYLLSRGRIIVIKHLNYENGCYFQNFRLVLYLDSYIGMCGSVFVGEAYRSRIVNISAVLVHSFVAKIINLFIRFFS